jgi:hypothetical protein
MTRFYTWMTALVILFALNSQPAEAQQVALKNNLLYDAAMTPNLGLEIGVGKKHTMQLFYGLHPWSFGHGDDQKYLKHWVVNPEWRYWTCHRFNGTFVGVHAFGGEYMAANIKMPLGWWKELRDHRFEGWYAGGGVSCGYQWVMSKHWNFEAAIGLGAAYIEYDKFKCGTCERKIDDGHKIYVGPTKAALSLMYMF